MRSLEELQAQCLLNNLPTGGSRESLMDRLRDHLGAGDELLDGLDPMKAKDLKNSIDWGTPNPYSRIERYFTADHIMEPKLDGVRLRLLITDTGVRLVTGRRSDKTYNYIDRSDNFPHLNLSQEVLTAFNGTILDGELLAPSSHITTATGVKTESLLNASVALCNVNPADAVATQEREGAATFHIFDVLSISGNICTHLTWMERRDCLESIHLAVDNEHIHLIPVYPSNIDSIELALTDGHEGVMIKTKTGPYQPGKRSANWLKVKTMGTADVFITGYLPGEGRNAGKVGALKCSVLDENGFPIEVAQPGAFTDEFRDELSAADGSLQPNWYNRVIEVMAQGRTKNGRLRHPQLVRLRPDKTQHECTLENLQDAITYAG